jgi:hypothetical protein
LVERFLYTEDVGGSSPSSPTITRLSSLRGIKAGHHVRLRRLGICRRRRREDDDPCGCSAGSDRGDIVAEIIETVREAALAPPDEPDPFDDDAPGG